MASHSLIALITGGTSGIGRATAKQLAKLGIRDLVVGRNAKRGDETLAEIRAEGGTASPPFLTLTENPLIVAR